MSLLTMIQDVALSIGLINEESDLTAVIGNTDPTINQLRALANKEGKDLSERYDWEGLVFGATFTTITAAGSNNYQGTFLESEETSALPLLVQSGIPYNYIINNTMWDTTNDRPIRGAMSHQAWSRNRNTNSAGPSFEYYENANRLLLSPAPSSGTGMHFLYKTKAWNRDFAQTLYQEKWVADSDFGILDESLMALGIEWRYLKSKGFDYSEEFNTYERRVQEAILHDRSHPVINLETSRIGGPGVLRLPEGSWPS